MNQPPDVQQEIGRRDWTRTNDPHHVKAPGTGERTYEASEPMSRNYDFTHCLPLSMYVGATIIPANGQYNVVLLPGFAKVFQTRDMLEAYAAGSELASMVSAARKLARS